MANPDDRPKAPTATHPIQLGAEMERFAFHWRERPVGSRIIVGCGYHSPDTGDTKTGRWRRSNGTGAAPKPPIHREPPHSKPNWHTYTEAAIDLLCEW